MKRNLLITALLLALPLCGLRAEDAATEIAARQEAEENFKRMNARVEDLQAAFDSQKRNSESLQKEIHKLQEEVARLNANSAGAATQESLKSLAKAIEEVDRKRIADNERTLAAFDQIAKLLGNKPPSSTNRNPPPPSGGGPTPPPRTGGEKGNKYAIRDTDTLSGIVIALNKQGYKITQKQIMDANPAVNWNRLKINQEIFIPEPNPK